MNISDILGAMVQTGMSSSSMDRLRNSMGGSNGLEGLSNMFGGAKGQGGGLGGMISSMLGGGGASSGGGITGALSSILGGGGSGGGLGSLLENVMGSASQAVGGKQNLALGGLGALAGALLGGGSSSAKGAVGGGLMALLGTMAFQALKGTGAQVPPEMPIGVREPETNAEKALLEQKAELILKAMLNAAKSDGQIDTQEMQRILGKLQELGADAETQQYLSNEMGKPMETELLIASAKNNPQLGAEIYAASLLAIEVDTLAEKAYIDDLAAKMGLAPEAASQIQGFVGMK
jgi:uncharacterized membrane protein YebE (DUF533 family)